MASNTAEDFDHVEQFLGGDEIATLTKLLEALPFGNYPGGNRTSVSNYGLFFYGDDEKVANIVEEGEESDNAGIVKGKLSYPTYSWHLPWRVLHDEITLSSAKFDAPLSRFVMNYDEDTLDMSPPGWALHDYARRINDEQNLHFDSAMIYCFRKGSDVMAAQKISEGFGKDGKIAMLFINNGRLIRLKTKDDAADKFEYTPESGTYSIFDESYFENHTWEVPSRVKAGPLFIIIFKQSAGSKRTPAKATTPGRAAPVVRPGGTKTPIRPPPRRPVGKVAEKKEEEEKDEEEAKTSGRLPPPKRPMGGDKTPAKKAEVEEEEGEQTPGEEEEEAKTPAKAKTPARLPPPKRPMGGAKTPAKKAEAEEGEEEGEEEEAKTPAKKEKEEEGEEEAKTPVKAKTPARLPPPRPSTGGAKTPAKTPARPTPKPTTPSKSPSKSSSEEVKAPQTPSKLPTKLIKPPSPSSSPLKKTPAKLPALKRTLPKLEKLKVLEEESEEEEEKVEKKKTPMRPTRTLNPVEVESSTEEEKEEKEVIRGKPASRATIVKPKTPSKASPAKTSPAKKSPTKTATTKTVLPPPRRPIPLKK